MRDPHTQTPPDVTVTVGSNPSCDHYLDALFATCPTGVHVELRVRTASGMARAFYGVDRLRDVAAAIAGHALHTDVYVGVLPRARQASRRSDLCSTGSVLWVDCDTPESAAALTNFVPAPSVVVASGSDGNCHGYWLLSAPVSIDDIEAANRRLAAALGADASCADAARVLRPPSWNHKTFPATEVGLLRCDIETRYDLGDVVPRVDVGVEVRRHDRRAAADITDPLLAIDPAFYVERLTGLHVGRDGKVRCPFHSDDRTPSLHVYAEPARGWYCYGCGRGGSVYDFAAHLWSVEPRGRAFVELRHRLAVSLVVPLNQASRSGRTPYFPS